MDYNYKLYRKFQFLVRYVQNPFIVTISDILKFWYRVVRDYINTMKKTFFKSFDCLQDFFELQVYKQIKKSFLSWQLLSVSMFLYIHAGKKLVINQNWNRKSSLLYWYNRLPLYVVSRLKNSYSKIRFQNEDMSVYALCAWDFRQFCLFSGLVEIRHLYRS